MRVSVILGHPYRESFNSAIAEGVVEELENNGYTVMFHDLYREHFNPVMPEVELVSDISEDALVVQHQNEIREADGIIIIHPNWWGQPPAILKGWIDRVLRENVAYTFPEGDNGGGLPIGLLKAKTGLIINTSNTAQEREDQVFGDPLNRLWKDCIFGFCGVDSFDRIMFRIVADSSEKQRQGWINQTKAFTELYFPSLTE